MKKIVLLFSFLLFCSAYSFAGCDYEKTALFGNSALMTDTVIVNEILCHGECFEINDSEFCVEGSYGITVENPSGDSTHYELDLTILPPLETFLEEVLCEGECYDVGGFAYCNSGFYTSLLISENGCDSTILLDLTILTGSTPNIIIGNTGPLDCVNTSVYLLANTTTSPGATYLWEGPGINPFNENQQSPEVFIGGVYTVTVTSQEGCSATASTEVLGNAAPPVIDINGNDPLNCNNLENTIIASSGTHQDIDYEWIDGGVVVSTGPEITVSETGILTLAIATLSGCVDTIEVEVTENNDPLFVDGGPNRHIQCEFILQLNAPGAAGTNVAYEWTTINGNILNGANTLLPVINKAGIYILTATDLDNGCTGSDQVIVYNSLTVIPNNVLTLDCSVTELIIDASESYNGANAYIQWTTTTGNIVEGGNSLTPLVDAPGSYQLVIVKPGCVSFATAVVLDDSDPPSINLQSDSDLLTCQNLSIDITATTNAAISTFFWTYNGNPFSVEQNITIVNPGTYTVVVTGANVCTNTASIEIGSDTEPNDIIIYGDTQLDCTQNGVGTLHVFASGESTFYTYNWFTLDGEILSNDNEEAVDIAGQGVYCVEIFNPVNGCTNLNCVDVVSVSSIEASADVTDVSCANSNNGSIEITDVTGGTPPFEYTWSNGQIGSSIITDLSPGEYTVWVSDIDGCYYTETFEVGISSNSTIVADAGDDEFFDCLTTFLVLDGSGSEFPQDATIEWTTLDGEILENGDTPFPSVGTPGTYTINIYNPQGCFDSDEVLVFETTADAGPDRFINCNFPSTNLDGTQSQGNGTYLWTTLDGNIVDGATTLTPTINAIGTYTLTVTSPNGCTATASTQVTGDFVAPEITGDDQILDSCIDPLTLSADADLPGTTFTWSGPNGTLSGQNPQVDEPGIYTVTGTAPNGCTNSATIEVIDQRFYPVATGEPVQYLNCFNGNPYTIELEIESQNGVYAFWSTDDGNILSQNNEIVVVDAAGTYEINYTDSGTGCEGSSVFVVEEDGVAITTTSTTTGCGLNDGTAGVSTTGIHHPEFEWSNGETTANVDGLAPGFYTVTISGSPGTCTEERTFEILQDPSCLVLVSGIVYDDDISLACDPEGNVTGKEGVLIHILPIDEYATTDENGYYEFLLPAGQYTVEALPVSPWVVNCPASEVINLTLPPGIAVAPGNDFFLEALSGFDLYGYGSSGSAPPGGTQIYQLTYCNNGFQTIHGTVYFTHSPLLTGFDVAASGASSYDPLTYTATWDFDDLSFFECEYIGFTLSVPADIPHGSVINSTMVVKPTTGDLSPNNNTYSWNKTVNNPSNTNVEGEAPELSVAVQASESVLMQNRPNPFTNETLIPFYIHTDEIVRLMIFDANGRLVKQFEGFEKGYNRVSVNARDLKGNGIYYYRLLTETEALTGKMILME